MKSKRTKATDIAPKIKKIVEQRDSVNGQPCCIFCGSPNAKGEAHVISRAQGGLGVEKNIVCVCRICHQNMDNSELRPIYVEKAKQYLKGIYPDWDEKDLIYNKWRGLKYD